LEQDLPGADKATVPVGDGPPTVVTVAVHVLNPPTLIVLGVQRRVVVVGKREVVVELAPPEGLEGRERRRMKTSATETAMPLKRDDAASAVSPVIGKQSPPCYLRLWTILRMEKREVLSAR